MDLPKLKEDCVTLHAMGTKPEIRIKGYKVNLGVILSEIMVTQIVSEEIVVEDETLNNIPHFQ